MGFRALITAAITATNGNSVVCPSNAARIQKFEILDRDFSVETGELTPTLKLKRKHAQEMHQDYIDYLYGEGPVPVPRMSNSSTGSLTSPAHVAVEEKKTSLAIVSVGSS